MVNAGVDPLYRLRRLGDGVGHALGKAESPPMPTPYEIAKAGGKHAGLLRQIPTMGPRQRRKSVESYREVIDEHLDKVASPEKHVPAWSTLLQSHRDSLIRGWQKEIADHQEQIAILKGYEDEHQ